MGAQTVELFPVLAKTCVRGARFQDFLFETIRDREFRPAGKRGFTLVNFQSQPLLL